MTFDLDTIPNSSDRVALAVDGLCCCQTRMAKLKPLTVEWFRSAMTPRYQPDGTVTYVLTPPRQIRTAPGYYIGLTFFVLIMFSLVAWARALGVFG